MGGCVLHISSHLHCSSHFSILLPPAKMTKGSFCRINGHLILIIVIKNTNRMQKSLIRSKPFCLACLFCRSEQNSYCGIILPKIQVNFLSECDTVAWSFSSSTGSGSLPTVPAASERKGPDTDQTGLWLSEKIILV